MPQTMPRQPRTKQLEGDLNAINQRLQSGEPLEDIAADYGCHRVTLERRLARLGYSVEQVETRIIRRLTPLAPHPLLGAVSGQPSA